MRIDVIQFKNNVKQKNERPHVQRTIKRMVNDLRITRPLLQTQTKAVQPHQEGIWVAVEMMLLGMKIFVEWFMNIN